ncbi:hypothetical protein [Candidatus Methylomicrobium oryzae]|uniref:hypothetical protein n=1 Tax=Candidatus Methylomicrobium oryzae TaxID=2802053 RepID=UPI0019239307|nr:hypothetical protein [Methylomicrobium sp. RS1]
MASRIISADLLKNSENSADSRNIPAARRLAHHKENQCCRITTVQPDNPFWLKNSKKFRHHVLIFQKMRKNKQDLPMTWQLLIFYAQDKNKIIPKSDNTPADLQNCDKARNCEELNKNLKIFCYI